MDPASGRLSKRDVFKNPNNPSWLAFDPARAHLYSANETATATYNGTGPAKEAVSVRKDARLSRKLNVGDGQ